MCDNLLPLSEHSYGKFKNTNGGGERERGDYQFTIRHVSRTVSILLVLWIIADLLALVPPLRKQGMRPHSQRAEYS